MKTIVAIILLTLSQTEPTITEQALAPRAMNFAHFVLKPRVTTYFIAAALFHDYVVLPLWHEEVRQFWEDVVNLRPTAVVFTGIYVFGLAWFVIHKWIWTVWPMWDEEWLARSA